MSWLGTRTSQEVPRETVLVLPVGATEQHGPHLPLDTDTVIASAVATRAAAEVQAAIVAPPIAIGASGEHSGFAGTLSIGTRVLAEALVEIVRTAGPEFARIVMVNGHGGNTEAVETAARICGAEGRPVSVWHARHPGGDAHAGRTETSIMLAIDAARVRLELIEPGDPRRLPEVIDELRDEGVAAVSANGVLGDPTGATAAEGRGILQAWVAEVVDILRA